ncbi:signal recognition particle subunit SRP72 [Tanacetum coccineum]
MGSTQPEHLSTDLNRRSGVVMGYLLAANGLLVLCNTINLFHMYYGDDWEGLFEVERDTPEDNPRNPAAEATEVEDKTCLENKVFPTGASDVGDLAVGGAPNRLNKLDDALESLKGLEKDSATMLLESQILFRQGKMDASVDIYQKLQKSKIESLEINLVAGLVSAGRSSEVQVVMDAIVGQETLMDENSTDEEIEKELAPIAGPCTAGNKPKAMSSYTDLIKRNLRDESSNAVAINNLIALKGPKDASDGLKKLDRIIQKNNGDQSFGLVPGLELKLSPKQKESIFINRILFLLHSNKINQSRELADALPQMFPSSVTPVLLQAVVFVKENKAGKAEEMLRKYAEKFPQKSQIGLLARAQIAATAGHPQIASESL